MKKGFMFKRLSTPWTTPGYTKLRQRMPCHGVECAMLANVDQVESLGGREGMLGPGSVCTAVVRILREKEGVETGKLAHSSV